MRGFQSSGPASRGRGCIRPRSGSGLRTPEFGLRQCRDPRPGAVGPDRQGRAPTPRDGRKKEKRERKKKKANLPSTAKTFRVVFETCGKFGDRGPRGRGPWPEAGGSFRPKWLGRTWLTPRQNPSGSSAARRPAVGSSSSDAGHSGGLSPPGRASRVIGARSGWRRRGSAVSAPPAQTGFGPDWADSSRSPRAAGMRLTQEGKNSAFGRGRQFEGSRSCRFKGRGPRGRERDREEIVEPRPILWGILFSFRSS